MPQGRDAEAAGFLEGLGCCYRLARGVLPDLDPSLSDLDPAVGSGSRGIRQSKANSKQLGRPNIIVNGGEVKGRERKPARKVPPTAIKTATTAATATATPGGAAVGVSGVDHRRYARAVDGALPGHMLSLMTVSLLRS